MIFWNALRPARLFSFGMKEGLSVKVGHSQGDYAHL